MRKISSISARPTSLRRSWRCVPSPQSKRSRSPPRRTSVALSARFAVGMDPDVPRKTTSRSTAVESRWSSPTQRRACASRYTHHAAHACLQLVRARAFSDAAPGISRRVGGGSRRRRNRAHLHALGRPARGGARGQRPRRRGLHRSRSRSDRRSRRQGRRHTCRGSPPPADGAASERRAWTQRLRTQRSPRLFDHAPRAHRATALEP